MDGDELFIVIDSVTDKEISDAEITKIARDGNLIEMDIDGFAITQDNRIILLDDCGNSVYLDMNRFSYKMCEVKDESIVQ